MYIILSAWLYVTLLMAITETNWVAGVLTFVFYGLLPGCLFWWLLGGMRQKRLWAQRQAERERHPADEAKTTAPKSLADKMPKQGD